MKREKVSNGAVVFNPFRKDSVASWQEDKLFMRRALENLGLSKYIMEVDTYFLETVAVYLKIKEREICIIYSARDNNRKDENVMVSFYADRKKDIKYVFGKKLRQKFMEVLFENRIREMLND